MGEVAEMTGGRGAWSLSGKSNGSIYYAYVSGKPQDGSESGKSLDHKAVNSAVKSIQGELIKLGEVLVVDGEFGQHTSDALKRAQKVLGVKVDGQFGPGTSRELFHASIAKASGDYAKYIFGQISQESNFDPGARGAVNAPDSGLVQINLDAHPEISWDQAFNPDFALPYSVNHLTTSLRKYISKPSIQISCAIASHNSPVWADEWFASGKAPNTTIQNYVTSVLNYSKEY